MAKSPAHEAPVVHAGDVHLLVVEDDDSIAEPMVEGLERAGFTVQRVATGSAALAALSTANLVLLDLGLPDMDGSEVCRRARATSDVPIIIVSARGDESERVLGLELGADDYLVKPFGMRELVARVRAVSRRGMPANDAPATQRVDAVEIDRRTRRVTVEGAELALSPKEFDLLSLLAEDPGAVVSRQQIMDEVWDSHWYGPTKTLDVHIASLRKKLGDPGFIETVRSVGFRLRHP
jgi:two-component system, OmpR family, response regulator RegX3